MKHDHPTTVPGDDHSEHGSEVVHTMSMYFHAGKNETVLFDFWITGNSDGAFVGSLIIIFIIAFFYEGLKYFREKLYQIHAQKKDTSSKTGLLGGVKTEMMSSFHCLQTILHMMQFVLSYFLMLIFMTYNVWLALAVTLGAGVGFFTFGWINKRAVDITEHCN